MAEEESVSVVRETKRVIKGASYLLAGSLGGRILDLIVRAILARALTLAEFGILFLGTTIVNVASSLSLIGIPQGVLRLIPYHRASNPERAKSLASLGALLASISSLVVSLILFYLADNLSLFFKEPMLSPVLKILSFGIFFLSLRTVLGGLYRCFDFEIISALSYDFSTNISRLILILPIVLLGYGLGGIAFVFLLAFAIPTLVLAYHSIKLGFFSTRGLSGDILRELVEFSLPLFLSQSLALIMMRADMLMLGYFRTSEEVGLYSAAASIARNLNIFQRAIVFMYLPLAASLVGSGKLGELRRLYRISSKWLIALSLPAIFLVVVFPGRVLQVIFGAHFMAGRWALRILGLAFSFGLMAGPLSTTAIALGRTDLVFLSSLLGAGSNVLLNYLLIPKLGILGAAIGTGASIVLINSILLVLLHIRYKISPIHSRLLRAIGGIVVAFPAGYLVALLLGKTIYSMLAGLVVMLASYALLLLILGIVEDEDIELIKAIERKTGVRLELLRRIARRFL